MVLLSRRNFIGQFSNPVFISVALIFSRCRPKQAPKEAKQFSGNPCENLSDLEAIEIEKRKTMGYVGVSTIPDRQCSNCKLYLPPKAENACGGCLLFRGPVEAKGNCISWTPLV
jgi:High potential iron-sulfur protein